MSFFETDENETLVDNSLFVEKYRPTKLADYVGNEHLKDTIGRFIEKGDIPHLLFYGKAGTGKTTLAKLIVKAIKCDELIINASDDNGIDTIRNKVKGFASTVGFKDLKIIVLDEFDFMTPNAQAMLRSLMEDFSKHCRFILTCNYIEKIIQPIRSRCTEFQIVPPTKEDVKEQVVNILIKEQIKYELKDVTPIIDTYYPDIRKIINTVQSNSSGGILKLNEEELINSDLKSDIINILKGGSSVDNKYKKIRRAIEDSRLQSFSELYTHLFNKVEEYGKDNSFAIIVLLAEGQYQESMVKDKKIQFISTIIKIVTLK